MDEPNGFLLVGITSNPPNLCKVVKCQIFSTGTKAVVISTYTFDGGYRNLAAGVIDTKNGYSYWYVLSRGLCSGTY